jgi:hypothetical protein
MTDKAMLEGVKNLAQLMRDKKSAGDRFALMLGAGASLSSGVEPTRRIMQEIVERYARDYHDGSVEERFGDLWRRSSADGGEDAAAADDLMYRWEGMGCDGAQAVKAASSRLGDPPCNYVLRKGEWLNLDGNSVITQGGLPAGAHSDIIHPQIAWAHSRLPPSSDPTFSCFKPRSTSATEEAARVVSTLVHDNRKPERFAGTAKTEKNVPG